MILSDVRRNVRRWWMKAQSLLSCNLQPKILLAPSSLSFPFSRKPPSPSVFSLPYSRQWPSLLQIFSPSVLSLSLSRYSLSPQALAHSRLLPFFSFLHRCFLKTFSSSPFFFTLAVRSTLPLVSFQPSLRPFFHSAANPFLFFLSTSPLSLPFDSPWSSLFSNFLTQLAVPSLLSFSGPFLVLSPSVSFFPPPTPFFLSLQPSVKPPTLSLFQNLAVTPPPLF